jgi:hypothetical protein
MQDFFFADNAGWFTIPAVLGTAFFVFRMIMMIAGGHDGGLDIDVDQGGDLHHGDPSDAFKLLSIQSIGAFLMGFGWGGVGALRGTGLSLSMSLLVAIACGVGMVWLLAILLKGLMQLQASGNIPLDAAMGAVGEVYAQVPARGEGRGQVRVVVDDRQRIYNAISDGDAIGSNSRVRVIGVNDDNTITVTHA